MGGAESEVRDGTTRIVFESAWFRPQSVRATARRLGLRTEASMRFERGADPTAQAVAMARACALLEFIGAGRAAGTLVDAQPRPYEPRQLPLTHRHVEALLGMPVPPGEAARILAALGFAAADAPGPAWRVTVPGWRPDVARPEDLIEEVGRHHGFEHLPATFPPVLQAPGPSDARIARDARRPAHAAGGRILRGDHLRVHRRVLGRAVRRRVAAGPPGQSAVGDLRGDAAQPVARAGRRGRPQPPPRAARRAALRDRHRLLTGR